MISLSCCLFESVMSNFHIFVNFPSFFWYFISSFLQQNSLLSEKIICMTVIFLNVLSFFFLSPNARSIMESIPCSLEKTCLWCSFCVEWFCLCVLGLIVYCYSSPLFFFTDHPFGWSVLYYKWVIESLIMFNCRFLSSVRSNFASYAFEPCC